MKYVSTSIPDSLSVKGIFTVLSPDLSYPRNGGGESHAFPEIFFVARGGHRISVDGVEMTIGCGQMVIYAPGSYHFSVSPSNSNVQIISFGVESGALALLYNKTITLTDKQIEEFESLFDVALSSFESIAPEDSVCGMVPREGVDDYMLQRIKLRLELFLMDLLESARENNTVLSRKDFRWDAEYSEVMEFMKRNLSHSLSLNKIAENCSMSVSKLKLLFREKYGGGPIACFLELKMEKAQALIREGDMNITEISADLGFNSVHYFSRIFKRQTGLSPTEFAKKTRHF